MHVRPATRQDIPAIADVRAAAFLDNVLSEFYAPYRHEYPLAWRNLGTNRLRLNFCTSGLWGFVCVSDTDDHSLLDEVGRPVPEGTILGFAWWMRSTSPSVEAKDPWRHNCDTFSHKVEASLRKIENYYGDHFCPNPSISQSNLASLKVLNIPQPMKNTVPHWYVASLAVHPSFQGKGVGRRLTQWGIDMLHEEWNAPTSKTYEEKKKETGSAITLIASPAGLLLYERMGFKIVGDGENGPHELGLPRTEAEPEFSMVYDPERLWTREPSEEEITKLDDKKREMLKGRKWVIWDLDRSEPIPKMPVPVALDDLVVAREARTSSEE